MEEAIGVLLIVGTVTIVPLLIVMHYVTKWKSLKGLSAEEQATLEQLWQDSEAMSERISVLERILDDKAPDWRRDQ